MQTLDRKIRVAKKVHKCDLCGLNIIVGEEYDWQKNVDDRELYEFKIHLSCLKLANKLDMFDECDEGLTSDDFYEFVSQEYPNITTGLKWIDVLQFVKDKHNIK
jgi:hypothetical protein